MIKIRVYSEAVEVKEVKNPRTGQEFQITEQAALAFVTDRNGKVNPHGMPILVTLRNRGPYKPGLYCLDQRSVYVNRFLQLEISPVLELINEETGELQAA